MRALLLSLCLLLAFGLARAADGGPSALPRREDVVYQLPGVGEDAFHTLSWQVEATPDFFAGVHDTVVPSVWQGGPVYQGLSWYWRETAIPGDILFVGFSTAAGDTVAYPEPVLWLPLDPAAGDSTWSTTSTATDGRTWTFAFRLLDADSLVVGNPAAPDTVRCWRITLEQTETMPAGIESASDGLGLPRPRELGAKAAPDTLWFEEGAIPRRRLAFRSASTPQLDLLYRSHLTRDEPVPTEGTGVGAFKGRW